MKFEISWVGYKNSFLRKKSSQTRAALDLTRVEKGKGIPDNTAPKSNFLFLSRTTTEPSVRIRGPNWRQEKLASRWVSSLASWIAGTYFKQTEASQEIKVKLNKSRLLKFYQVKQMKENSIKNSAKKNFKEDSQFIEPSNISTNQKKEKKNTQIQRTLFPGHSLR